ncbi:MAG: hypothetical protein J3Q66DRAFT_431007 [Benniella sp.]|nr:MAG: hypothetical protein J3Q66DRAFT_431007 [Benniella sp.]
MDDAAGAAPKGTERSTAPANSIVSRALHADARSKTITQHTLHFYTVHAMTNVQEFIDLKIGRASSSTEDNLTKLSEFDVSVALSGIINARMKDVPSHFDQETLDLIKSKCYRHNFCHPDDIPGLKTILDELRKRSITNVHLNESLFSRLSASMRTSQL